MRYLAVFALLFAACGEYDEGDFSEPVLCFEDGTEGKVSEVQPPEENADPRLGQADLPAEPDAKRVHIPCIVEVMLDPHLDGCYIYICSGYCALEDLLKNPDIIFCGSEICYPRQDGWTEPGYPPPEGPNMEKSVH